MYPPPPPADPYGPSPAPGSPAAPHLPPRQTTRPPRRQRGFWSLAGTVGAVVVAGFLALAGASFAFMGELTTAELLLAMLWFGVACGVGAAMCWRTTHPVAVCIATAAVGVVGPVGAVAPLIALPWVIARTDLRRSLLCGGATALALIATFWRDGTRDGEAVIFSMVVEGSGTTSYMSPIGYTVLGVLALGLSVGVGMLRRVASRADADARVARQSATAEARRAEGLRRESDALRTELTRQEERELIAREMHDTVAHQLSLVSLEASSLEVSSEDAEVGDAARSMRSSAHRALEEMRTLIRSLRDGADGYTGAAPSLPDLAELLDGARSRGVDVTATVFVTDADAAPPTLTRTVYRVVQESLTNAAKHAPGARVEADIRARPGAGIEITVRNVLAGTGGRGVAPGSGSGLVGMRERVEALEGTIDAGPRDGWFVVRVQLPWSPVRD